MGQLVVADDGRRLAVECWGPTDGYPIFLLHGTPGSRLGPRPKTRDLHLSGIRLIAYDRPGYGRSDRRESRQVEHAAKDVAAIARDFGVQSFSVMGRSGGAPHALACAALLPPGTVRSAAVLVSLAPPDAEDLTWSDGAWTNGMTQSNIEAFRLAREDRAGLRAQMLDRRTAINSDPEQIIDDLDSELSPGDRRIVMETGVRNMLVHNFAAAFDPDHNGSRPDGEWAGLSGSGHDLPTADYGLDGWYDDVVSFVQPWGFDVSKIDVPVLLWHGELDRFSPVDHFHWLAEHIKDSTAVIEPDRAHFGAVQALPKVMRWLVTAATSDRVADPTTTDVERASVRA